PTVIVQSEPATEMHTVSVDQRSGAESAVKHLIELGHKSILHLAGPMDWHDSRVRAQAFQETLEAAGLASAPPIIGDGSSDSDRPTVIVQSERATEMHTVSVDQRSGAESAVKHLIELGHKSILHLAGPMDWHDSRVRAQAFQETLEAAGLASAPPIIGDWSSDSGYEAGKSADLGDATAIFASNDQMALGLIHGLQDRGLKVPDDMSIVGFDDLPDARHFLPPLTTIRQNFSDLGIQVIELLVRAIEGGVTPYARELIEPKLITRLSTGVPPKK